MGLPTLETERLILRPWSLDDIDALHQVWTDPQVRRYLWDDEVISRQRAAAAVEDGVAAANRNGVGLWCVLPKPAGALAGFCGFRYIDDAPDIELLYGLLPDYWGQGLATEAARAALAYGFDGGGCPLTGNHLVIPKVAADLRIGPDLVQSVDVVERPGAQDQALCFQDGQAHALPF